MKDLLNKLMGNQDPLEYEAIHEQFIEKYKGFLKKRSDILIKHLVPPLSEMIEWIDAHEKFLSEDRRIYSNVKSIRNGLNKDLERALESDKDHITSV